MLFQQNNLVCFFTCTFHCCVVRSFNHFQVLKNRQQVWRRQLARMHCACARLMLALFYWSYLLFFNRQSNHSVQSELARVGPYVQYQSFELHQMPFTYKCTCNSSHCFYSDVAVINNGKVFTYWSRYTKVDIKKMDRKSDGYN